MEAAKQKTTAAAAKTQPAAAQKVQRKAGVAAQQAQRTAGAASPRLQLSGRVSSPHDPAEKEADATAKKILGMASPESSAPRQGSGSSLPPSPAPGRSAAGAPLSRKGGEEDKLQRQATGEPGAGTGVLAEIENSKGEGSPLPSGVRRFMEPRFRADFSQVRVHTGERAARLNRQLNAHAFTTGNHVFFARDRFRPESRDGKELIAHELTHTVQQGGVVQRRADLPITPTQPHIQRSVAGRILDWCADKANNIPGFRMLTIILGVNPITMDKVDRSPANILRALIEVMPGGAVITQALENHGVFAKIAAWIDGKIKELGMVGAQLKSALSDFLATLSGSDLAPWNWGDVWSRAKRIFTAPIDRLISFAAGVVTDILRFVKDAILKPLAALAQGTRGYDLLKALLGEDPITGEPVPRTADTLIGGFMKLIGQEDVWENLKKGKAVERAWAWFKGALAGLVGMMKAIPARIVTTLKSLTFVDIITVAGAFAKIVGTFANIAVEFMSWGLKQVIDLLEILFSVVAPGVIPYLKKARAAFVSILKNPIGFVGNLVRAGRLGFETFAANILEHLKAALIKWLVGPLAEAGVYIPKSFSLMEIVKLVLSVLGLTWENIRSKLVRIIPEPVLAGLEKTAAILVTLVKEGPAAAWEQIKAELAELKDQLISQVTQMITTEVVKAAVMKLVSMLNPAGAVIQAIIAIYNTITFVIQKLQQIAAVAASFIDSIAAIAAGQVAGAARKVEQTLANTLTLVIAFLAKFAGLGGIPEKLVGIVRKIRAPIDRGLDRIVAWLGGMLKKMVGGVKSLAAGVLQWWKQRRSFRTKRGKGHELYFTGSDTAPLPWVASNDPGEVRGRLAGWLKAAGGATATPAMKESTGKIGRARAIDSQLRAAPGQAKVDAEALQKELTGILGELFDAFEAEVDSGAPVLASGISVTPKVTYRTKSLKLGSKSGTVGYHMTSEFLAPNHPQGSSPGASEQAELFTVLPTKDKVGGKGYSQRQVFIKGHLLNDNVGGPGVAKNLFPITGQANSDHKNRIESDLKNLVNNKGYLVFYEVKVTGDSVAPIPGFTVGSEQMYQVRATLNCEVDTYHKTPKNTLERQGKSKSLTIGSVYDAPAMPKVPKGPAFAPAAGAMAMTGFDAKLVKWAPSRDRAGGKVPQ